MELQRLTDCVLQMELHGCPTEDHVSSHMTWYRAVFYRSSV